MTYEIKVTLKETSEALGTWVSEEVNGLVFITEVIGQFERSLEKEGLTIQKTVHPKEDRVKAFYVIDLGWFSVMFYHRDWVKDEVVSINVNIKNITSHPNPDGSNNPHTCLTVDMFMKFGERLKVLHHYYTHYIASGITYRDVLGDEKIAEINKVVKVINDMNNTIPDFDKIDINL